MPHTEKNDPHAMFVADGDGFQPTRYSLGYWAPGTLTGSAVASLLGHVIEARHGEAGFVPVRFCVDLMALVAADAVHVETRVIKSGGRLRLVEAEIHSGGSLKARATLQFLRETQSPANPTWQTPQWAAPAPDGIEHRIRKGAWELRPIPAHGSSTQRFSPGLADPALGNPPVLGELSPVSARQTWLEVDRAIVEGVPHTPFSRLALAADFASPLAHSSEAGIDYVNTDFTIYAHRLPVGGWLGFEQIGHLSRQGIAVGECRIHDLDGPVGTISVSALAQTKVNRPR